MLLSWDVIGLFVIGLVVIIACHWVYTWKNPKCNGNLPPGSMGLPILGETIHFFTPNPTFNIQPFVKKRLYGPLFKTSLVGQKVIVSTDEEINHHVLQKEEVSFVAAFTESFINITGQNSLLQHHGMVHKYLRNLALHLVGPENLKKNFLPEIDKEIRIRIRSWASQGVTDVKEAVSDLLFEYFAKELFSYEEAKASKKLRKNFNAFLDGLISFPLNIPGTAYHSCLQGRKNVIKVIKDTIEERKSSNTKSGDYLDYLLEELKKENAILNEKIVLDFVFLLLYGAFESVSSIITLAIKYLSDHPQVLDELKKEHEILLKSRKINHQDSAITWEEYKSLNFTHMVINETVRLANLVPLLFRRALKDVHIKGYTIPKDWLVMIVPLAVHLNPNYYTNPFEFNPSRWEGKKLHAGSKTFMAFGGGIRLCAGAEFTKLQVAILLHYLVTKYRWTIIEGGEIIRKPGLTFPNGLHVKISELN